MKYYLERSPLVLAVIHFRVEGISGIEESIQDLRSALTEIGLPGFHEGQMEERSFHIGSDGLTVQATQSKSSRYTFTGAGSFEQLQIVDGHVILKVTLYPGFNTFFERFRSVLEICERCIPSFKSCLINRVSTRYVNLFAPESGEARAFFRGDEAVDFPRELDSKPIYSSITKLLKTAKDRQLRIRVEELPTDGKRVSKLLPDDLMESDPNSLMKIQGHPWWADLDSSSYSIVDVDHIQLFPDKPAYQRDYLLSSLTELHDKSSDVFWLLISDHAEKIWGKKECT